MADQERQGIPVERTIHLIAAGWLLARGLLWVYSAFFPPLDVVYQMVRLTNGLLGGFCVLLALQLIYRIPGARVPAIAILLLHSALHIHRWAVIDAAGWWATTTAVRLQIIFEGGVATFIAFSLMVPIRGYRRVKTSP